MDQLHDEDLPLRDEAKARREWRGDDETPEGSGQGSASDDPEGGVLKDVAEGPPD